MTIDAIILSSKGFHGPYGLVIAASLILIFSYFFNLIAKKTNIPSPLLLILLGILIKLGMSYAKGQGLIPRDDIPYEGVVLEILGTIGLIFIVLEGALDLKLSKDKWPVIWRSFVVALLGLVLSTAAIAWVFELFLFDSWGQSILYALPLAIMSSAIIIPSVSGLEEGNREFMIYESSFSDILGIMCFYMLLGNSDAESTGEIWRSVTANIGLTLILSLAVCYALVYVLQRITGQVKLFLTIAILALLYVLGKSFELSSLVMILVFGLMLNNYKVFWRGKMRTWLSEEKMGEVLKEFHIVTLETAFVVRTFFFVIFGITIILSTLLDLSVVFYSLLIIVALYVVRLLFLYLFKRRNIFPLLYIAPRGLITILLFFKIPSEAPAKWVDPNFNEGILLFVIIATSLVMTISLIQHGMRPYENAVDNPELDAQTPDEFIDGQNLESED